MEQLRITQKELMDLPNGELIIVEWSEDNRCLGKLIKGRFDTDNSRTFQPLNPLNSDPEEGAITMKGYDHYSLNGQPNVPPSWKIGAQDAGPAVYHIFKEI
jgi:hypothetical protein